MNKRSYCLPFLIFLFGVTFPSLLQSQSNSLRAQDGNDWIFGRKDEFKGFYLQGLIGGVIMGAQVAGQETEGGIEIAIDSLKRTKANENIIALVENTKKRLGMVQIVGITIGQMVEGIDIFYSDFANKRIKIIDAIYAVKMQIDGQDPDLIQAQIRYLRMPRMPQEEFTKISTKIGNEPQTVTEEEWLKMGNYNGHRLFRYGNY